MDGERFYLLWCVCWVISRAHSSAGFFGGCYEEAPGSGRKSLAVGIPGEAVHRKRSYEKILANFLNSKF